MKPQGGLRTAMSFADKPTFSKSPSPAIRTTTTSTRVINSTTEPTDGSVERSRYRGDGFLGLAILFSETVSAKFVKTGIPFPMLTSYFKLIESFLDCGKELEVHKRALLETAGPREKESLQRSLRYSYSSAFTKICKSFMYAPDSSLCSKANDSVEN